MEKRAYRNTHDKVIAGVCTGLGEYFSIDPLFIRIVFLLCFFEPPIAVLGYIGLWIALPKKPLEMPMIGNQESSDTSSKTFEQRAEEFGREAEIIGEKFGKEAEQFGEELGRKVEAAAENLEGKMKNAFDDNKVTFNLTIDSKPRKGKALGFILIALGVIFLAHNYLPEFDFERFWPIILIAIGFSILFSGNKENKS